MGRLILIKHSLPFVDEAQPSLKWQLSAEGEQRASTLAVAVAALKPGSLHSSAEIKAMQTAEFIGVVTGLALNMDPNFNEHERSRVPFLSNEDFKAQVADALGRPTERVFGSETIEAAVNRFSDALSDAERFAPPGDMAVVSHGTVISAYVASRTGDDPVAVWQSLGLPGLICLNWPNPERIEMRQNFE